MTRHILKIDAKWYDAVNNNIKTFQVRKNDRDFKVGDSIAFKVVDSGMVNHQVTREYAIKYILTHEDFPDGIKEGYCVMAIKKRRQD